jgi:hypothetical protein
MASLKLLFKKPIHQEVTKHRLLGTPNVKAGER